MMAHRQWASRPNDERYLSIEDLGAFVNRQKEQSWTVAQGTDILEVLPTEDGDLVLKVQDYTSNEERYLTPTHHGFNQLCSYANFPARPLRQLPHG
jgi:hypothetical protein